eukprot:4745063-Amphidinium_carterae.9
MREDDEDPTGEQNEKVLSEVEMIEPKSQQSSPTAATALWLSRVPGLGSGSEGPDFKAEVKTWAHFYGIVVHRIDARASHQQGRTERLGGALKEQVRLASELEDTLELSHFQHLVHACCISRNRFIDQSGYSAEQRVVGTARRWPSELTQDDAIAEDVMAMNSKGSSDYEVAQKLRFAALQALAKQYSSCSGKSSS